LCPTLDDFANRNYVEYFDYDIYNISRKILECGQRLDEIRANKAIVHEYVSKNYDWSVVTSNLLNFFG